MLCPSNFHFLTIQCVNSTLMLWDLTKSKLTKFYIPIHNLSHPRRGLWSSFIIALEKWTCEGRYDYELIVKVAEWAHLHPMGLISHAIFCQTHICGSHSLPNNEGQLWLYESRAPTPSFQNDEKGVGPVGPVGHGLITLAPPTYSTSSMHVP